MTNPTGMKTIFDLGMYDASDTVYYLEAGFRVVAVEANPALARRAQAALENYVKSGQLDIVNAAIGLSNEPIELTVCGDDLGASSTNEKSVAHRTPIGKFTVAGITTQELFARFGIPYYLKIDLEGADKFCVQALSASAKPDFLSFEIGDDLEVLLAHVASIGFSKFKLINQCNFRELSNENNYYDRAALRIVSALGFADPKYVKRRGRLFKLGHSSGPVPWHSDGTWCSQIELLRKWNRARARKQGYDWYDLHAM